MTENLFARFRGLVNGLPRFVVPSFEDYNRASPTRVMKAVEKGGSRRLIQVLSLLKRRQLSNLELNVKAQETHSIALRKKMTTRC